MTNTPHPDDAPNPHLVRAGLDTARIAELNGGVVSETQEQLERYARFDWSTLGRLFDDDDDEERTP